MVCVYLCFSRAALSSMWATGHIGLFKLSKIKLKLEIQSLFAVAVFQMLDSHVLTVAMLLHN